LFREYLFCNRQTYKISHSVIKFKSRSFTIFESSPKTGTGDLIISVQALVPLKTPIPTPEIEKPIIKLVDKILKAKKQDKIPTT